MKEEILQSALQIAQRDGWNQVTTRRITKEFGYTTSAIYYYLGGKDELLTELQRQGFTQLKTRMQSAANAYPDKPEAQLMAISSAFWEFAHTNRSLYELMFGLAAVTCNGLSTGEVQQAGAVVQNVLGKLSSAPVMSLFLNWWALVSGFVAISFSSSGEWGRHVPESFLAGVDRFIESI